MELTNPAFVLLVIGIVVVFGLCWWRRRRRNRPVDTRELDALTRRANRVTRSYEDLVPTTTKDKDTVVTSSENPAQADIDADVQQLSADIGTLASVQQQISDLVTAAQQANTPVDTSALDALVQQAAPVVSNYQNLIPAPAPTPDPTPAPDAGN